MFSKANPRYVPNPRTAGKGQTNVHKNKIKLALYQRKGIKTERGLDLGEVFDHQATS